MAHPDFGRSVNPISIKGDRLCPPNNYWHTRIFRLSDGPEMENRIILAENSKDVAVSGVQWVQQYPPFVSGIEVKTFRLE